ncbi:MAG: CoA-binding protein [Cyclobacteriaceae bacterium]|nr:CoA-binding protein [Cyclobacteriaceae bacterium]
MPKIYDYKKIFNMPTLKESAEQFLQLKNIAVAGVSSTKKDAANYIYEKLKKTGYNVFAINPNAKEIDGDPCYPNLASVPEKIEGVVIGTNSKVTLTVVQECATLGIQHAWIHKSFDGGSYSEEAEIFCKENGVNLIPTGCPMMFCKPVDFAHKCIKWVLHATGKMPRKY